MKITPVSRLSVFLAILTVGACAQTPESQSQDAHFTRNFNASAGSTLVVENYKGTIHVTGASGNQVTVTVDKKFEGSDKDRKWWMENTRVSFDSESSRVRVKVEYPNNSCILSCNEDEHSDYSAWVELTIEVPRKTNLDIDGYKPDIKLASLDGDIHIKSYKSPIDIASTIGGIDISTYKESVRLHDVSIRGNLELKMEKGEATIEAKNLGKEAEIESGKGTVVIRIPRSVGLTVDYSGNRRASFHSDLPIASTAGFRSDEMRGTINGGGTQLRLRTDKGSISIEALR